MTARSFRLVFGLVLKLFALETDYSRVVSLLREPKTLSCARVWLKKKTECYALCFSQNLKTVGEVLDAMIAAASLLSSGSLNLQKRGHSRLHPNVGFAASAPQQSSSKQSDPQVTLKMCLQHVAAVTT